MSPDASQTELVQVERYEFRATFPGAPYGPWTVDESPPVGNDHGPNPVRILSLAVGQCMSSTLVNTCERAHVPIHPVRTVVRATVGRNDRGRLRVQLIEIDLVTAPQDGADAERFAHCVEIFPDFCTVSGAVRAGVAIAHRVVAP
jgi:uncharacterized OsmC-like protein